MKILVIDDSVNNQRSAQQGLGTLHDLTVVNNFDEAFELTYSERWDVVLCDLMMPAGSYAQGAKGSKYVGQEMPVGWALAITAALYGAKYVAVVTNTNHHDHPASAMLDAMCNSQFRIHGASAIFTGTPGSVKIEGTEERGKDWAMILERLLGGRTLEPWERAPL